MKTLAVSALNPLIPVIGNYLTEDNGPGKKEEIFLLYGHVRYLFALYIIVPILVLIDDFVAMWLGPDMIIPRILTILIGAEFYIDLVHSATADFISSAGLFRDARNIEFIGAATNLLSSLILVRFFGVAGVLAGTVISQIIFWIGRSYVTYKKCLCTNRKKFWQYWCNNVVYVMVFLVGYYLCKSFYAFIQPRDMLWRFLLGGICCEGVLLVYSSIVFAKSRQHRALMVFARETAGKLVDRIKHR